MATELEIVWLHNPKNYDYLREAVYPCRSRVRFPLKSFDPARHTDGGPSAHIVAYATLSPDSQSSFGYFNRRYWWVKSYDRFVGCHSIPTPRSNNPSSNSGVYETNCPCEAVKPDSILVNQPSERGCLSNLVLKIENEVAP